MCDTKRRRRNRVPVNGRSLHPHRIAFAMAIETNEFETFASDVEDRLSDVAPTGGI
jgi:hypothetical protein